MGKLTKLLLIIMAFASKECKENTVTSKTKKYNIQAPGLNYTHKHYSKDGSDLYGFRITDTFPDVFVIQSLN